MVLLGWLGNALIIAGLWGVGDKRRSLLWCSMAGELLYIVRSALVRDWSLFAVCVVFFVMAARTYWKWGKTC